MKMIRLPWSPLVTNVLGTVARAILVETQLRALVSEYRTGKLTDRAFVKRAIALFETPGLAPTKGKSVRR